MKKNWYYMLITLGVGCCSFAFSNVETTSMDTNKFIIDNENVLKASTSISDNYVEGSEINDGSLTASIKSITTTETSTCFQVEVTCSSSEKDYYIGYYNSSDYKPGVIKCTLKDNKGNTKIGYGELLRVNTLLDTNQAGGHLGQTTFTTYCDIVHGADYSLNLSEDIKILNIFNYDFEEKTTDLNTYQYLKADSESITNYSIDTFISYSYAGKSNLNGFASYKINVDCTEKEEDGAGYKSLGATYKRLYSSNQDAIDKGTMYVRTRFGFSGDTYYKVTYKDGTSEDIYDVSNFVDVTSKGSNIYFLLKGVNDENVSNIQVVGGIITLGIYNSETYKEVSRTGIQIRFGYMNFKIDDIKNEDGTVAISKSVNTYDVNSDLLIGLSVGLVSFVYIAVSLVLFFVFSKKYKDDEFRRVNPRLYWKTNILGLLAIDSVLMFIEFTAVRVNLISNSLPIFNPADAFICAFAVASLLLVGYFIKYFYILFKAKYERRRNEKLKMNNNVIDDGTLIINK